MDAEVREGGPSSDAKFLEQVRAVIEIHLTIEDFGVEALGLHVRPPDGKVKKTI